ncbi:NAD(P)/FAD-dependent oxidoreductase (plasmid) [Rhizobium sullae]|uniref:NAD(P)/FAD-dependent oxidoreductase n=2 Tax=Rhizobium sullae TaxID=50338 RepID=A0ABY5XVJ7_RHISU|nr:NAD(P)/FAD-dependent oxidoreductase [Rhizobium sullae]UWU18648.1 NAD(P)/FAD-dependent oxidoreductase [Rhizobium sullae]
MSGSQSDEVAMTSQSCKIVIIGGGIAGLCAAIYARKCGYEVELLEQHHSPGGLAASWKRGDYTFETCLHWLLGSKPGGTLHAQWQEVCDIDSLSFVYAREYLRLEDEHGGSLSIYTDVERLERELLNAAPEDEIEIRHLAGAIRQLGDLPMPGLGEGWPQKALDLVRIMPDLPLLWRLSHISVEEYGQRFNHPLLRRFFGAGAMGHLSVLALIISLGWMSTGNAGYAIGGAQALIRLIAEKLTALGGRVRYDAKVERILVEDEAAVGVQLAGGEIVKADWVLSAADGHTTIYEMLGGKYRDRTVDAAYDNFETFPSYLQVSFGVARDLSDQPGYVTRVLNEPLEIDPQTALPDVSFRLFHFDPTFAPKGKTAVTCFLPTHNFSYWADLREHDPRAYQAEKHRVAEAVIAILERRMPGIGADIEITDISTPASVIRYTGSWKGSMEGWLMTPETGPKSLPLTLPGLRQFLRAGQWVQVGGGLPTGLMTARAAVQTMCRQDHILFSA